jgi:hypothetical protein
VRQGFAVQASNVDKIAPLSNPFSNKGRRNKQLQQEGAELSQQQQQ